MAPWMAYALVLSLLFAAAARVGEEGLDLFGWPTRWVWITAMAAGVVVPLLAYAAVSGGAAGVPLPSGPAAPGASGGGDATVLPVLLTGDLVAQGGAALIDELRFLDPWLVGGWIAASLLTAGWLLAGWLRLRLRRRAWAETEIDGCDVLISPDEGPAVTGFVRGMILLPSWFEELDRDLRPLVLRHEREHLAVGDHRLLAAGLGALVLCPWNPVLWWSLARLRQAMEIDCDRRVLGDGVDRAAYGELLVQVGERAGGPPLTTAAFADSSSFLERRIRRLAKPAPSSRAGRSAAAVGLAVLLGGAVAWVPVPDEPVRVADLQAAPPSARGSAAPGGGAAVRVTPPVSAVMRLDLRLYMKGPADGGQAAADRRAEKKLDIEAVRLAKQLSYACAPYLNGAGERGARTARRGCFVVVDGEPAHPSILRELGSGAIASIRMLRASEAVERFGSEARNGAYVIRTERS